MESIINEINEIIDCPSKYLIDYYDNLKLKVDIHYETKLQRIQDVQLREEITKRLVKFIHIIDTCFEKCIKNTLPSELVSQARELLSKVEPSYKKLEKMKISLQSHLFANNSYLAIYFQPNNLAFFIERGFHPTRVEW